MSRSEHAWLLEAVAKPENGWAMGTFGAIAEFTRDPDEPAEVRTGNGMAAAATSRGAIRLALRHDLVPLAYETPNYDGETWSHAVALCLPVGEAQMNRRSVLTELGPDKEAIRPQDRDAILFDMGLGTLPVDVCIRTADPDLISTLRSNTNRSLFDPGNPAMGAIVVAGPHRVFVGQAGRAEVYQPIPPPGGRSPDGPHTHVLPNLLRSGRTHAATTPIPDGLIPCAHLFPPNPVRDVEGRRRPFDAGAHDGFRELFGRFGRPDAIRLKRDIQEGIAAGRPPLDPTALDKHARACLRVTLRQLRALDPADRSVKAWQERLDRPSGSPDDNEDEQPAH